MADQLMPGMPDRTQAGKIMEDTMEQARTAAANAGEQVWSAAANVGATAQDLAVKAREQTAMATDMLYQQGSRASEYLTRNVNAYPLTALLLAGALGYGMAYLLHRSWASEDRMTVKSFG